MDITDGDVIECWSNCINSTNSNDVTVENNKILLLLELYLHLVFLLELYKVRDGSSKCLFVSGSTSILAEEGNTYTSLSPTGGNGLD